MLVAVRGPRALFATCAIAAVVTGVALAAARYWMCDDAFISFRYADHLVRGHGLVFSLGERVEGFTNLAWTLWAALGLGLGVPAETWAGMSGILCFGATLALLGHRGWAIPRGALPPAPPAEPSGSPPPASLRSGARWGARGAAVAWPLPAAALLGAVHREWTIFATGGLETSAFTLLAFAGYLLVCPVGGPDAAPRAGARRLVAAGLVLALASLTRPDGVLFGVVCGAWLLAGRDLRGALVFAAGFAALWLPATIWRVAYYGDVFPNTYYAKSASVAWWSQGAYYAGIYFARYWPLLLALPCAALVRPRRAAGLELALAAVYALYVIRVGGDFMFARLLIPVAPFLLLLVERGLDALLGARPRVRAAAIAALGVGLVATPSPVAGSQRVHGIADENYVYTRAFPHWAERADANGAELARLFDGLPIAVGFFGLQARLVYRSRVATAIECETGLTDAAIAHQELPERGRIGHEKHARLPYLLARHVDLLLTRDPTASERLQLDDQLPTVPIELGRIAGQVITWDPATMAALAARGVRVPDVPAQIDAYVARMASRSDAEVRRDWERYRRLYFDRTPDPAREQPFRRRLGL
jgi:hypothetical protein